MRAGAIVLALITVTGLSACKRPEEPRQAIARLTPEQAAAARRTITRWLECDECTEGQLKAVTRLGPAAIPTLGAVLREGASPAKREFLSRALTRSYQDLRSYARTHSQARVTMTEAEYVRTYSDNYDALIRARAAGALRAIGGPHARKVLEDAPSGLRQDVEAAIRTARDSMR